MDLKSYIQGLYEQTYITLTMPNITKLNQDLMKILSEIYNDESTKNKQFKYLKERILDSCTAIIDNIDEIEEQKDNKWWAFFLLLDGKEIKLLDPQQTQKQEENLSKNVDEYNQAVDGNATHKRWDWTGRGKTTRHKSNNSQIVAIDEPFEIVNDKTGEIANLMFPGDVSNDPSGSNSVICYCNISYLNSEIAKKRLNSVNKTNINNTILIDTNNVYNQEQEWKLSEQGIQATYEILKTKLPINVELTHLMQLDVDKPIYDELGYDQVVTINDVELTKNGIIITDSTINNRDIVPLVSKGLVNGISMNYIDYNDINAPVKDQPLNILSASLVNIPSCPKCNIQMAKKKGDKNMDKEDLKMIAELISKSFEGLKDELIAINKPKKETEKETEKRIEDNTVSRMELKKEIEKELHEELLTSESNSFVDSLIKDGKILPEEKEANVAMAKANLEQYKKIMKPVEQNDIFKIVVDPNAQINNDNKFKILNAKFRKGEL